ncbi:oligosaccharide flippase family protein [Bradyrhizobium arachidis]|uniref:Lipopolysaccharide biosynthesis protein n=1 Tax=Bradyrhizobium arachidis TaxID=858423 RepID=A0AAE7TFN0_9BRAD|nr:oligosaccharide flippase family protein [Bradyrhizobium arachidis]QOZ66938.1 lipopolysaccharide biosynthesis protein [Bradyrhizobium arachidis]SFV13824.1 Membrane protein involved in the export of O-antigen and teichoic acid [Bradyrhizobium arachidis]
MSLTSLIRSYWGRPLVRSIAVVLTGTAAAQVITVAASPILSRLFDPAAFGALGTFMAIVVLVNAVATLTYSAAIVLPAHDDDALALVWVSLLSSFAVATALLLGIGLYLGWLDRVETTQFLLFVLPLQVVFEALLQAAQQWMLRKKRYATSARVIIAQAIVVSLSKVLVGVFWPTAFALILVSMLASPFSSVVFLLWLNVGGERWPAWVSVQRTRLMARRYVDFPLFRAPQTLVSAVSQSSPLLLLAVFHGHVAAGFFSLCNSALGAPAWLLAKTINDIFFPRLAELANHGQETRPLLLKATGALCAITALPFGILILFGPQIFGLVFGAKWTEAGSYSQFLSFVFLTAIITRPAFAAASVYRVQPAYLVYEILSIIVRLGALSINVFVKTDPIVPVALFSLAGSLANIGFLGYILGVATKFDRKLKLEKQSTQT